MSITVETIPGTTHTITDADDGKLLKFTNAADITVTCPGTVSEGIESVHVQAGAGQITYVTSAGGVIQNTSVPQSRKPTAYIAVTLEATGVFMMNGLLGSAQALVKSNFAATAAPTVSDDDTLDFTVASLWMDITNDNAYICLDASTGAAVWLQIDNAAGNAPSVQVFTSSGTWNKPAGLVAAKVTVLGGGGAGGGTNGNPRRGQGGSAGGTSVKYILDGALGSSETITIGAGGVAVTGNAGGNGGSSSFGAHASSTGGTGGAANIPLTGQHTPNAGGVGSSGDENLTGGEGAIGSISSAAANSGDGGASSKGGGGGSIHNDAASIAGSAGVAPGSGGSGSATGTGTNSVAGGNGAPGIIIVEEFK